MNIIKPHYILVTPFESQPEAIGACIKVDRLRFWYKNQLSHEVSDDTLKYFLNRAEQFGALIYPGQPGYGCEAFNPTPLLEKGWRAVHRITFGGELVYLAPAVRSPFLQWMDTHL